MVKTASGAEQVTYAGHPLYYFAQDTSPGDTKGQGSNGFGAKWWLVSPAGVGIAAASAAPSPSGGGGHGY